VIPTDPLTRVSLRVITAARGATAFSARNVDTAQGVAVPALRPGNYLGVWELTDSNGDRRLVVTRFIARVGRTGAAPRSKVSCRHAGPRIRCSVTFPRNRKLHGKLKLRLARGGTVVALGHGTVRRGRATVSMRVLKDVSRGSWKLTFVLTQPNLLPVTVHRGLRTVG
jgi:hypothetical protein